jgi:hypothetical protein
MHNYHRVLVKLRVCNGLGWVGVIVGVRDHDVPESVRQRYVMSSGACVAHAVVQRRCDICVTWHGGLESINLKQVYKYKEQRATQATVGCIIIFSHDLEHCVL